MWIPLSLQTRLSVLFCAMLMGAFALALAGLLVFSSEHLEDERGPIIATAQQLAGAVSAEMAADPAHREVLTRVLKRLNERSAGNLRYRDEGTSYEQPASPALIVPTWFSHLIGAETKAMRFPIAGSSAELLLYPSDAADIYEKWIAFLTIVTAPLVLGLLAFGISQLTVRATLRPLRELAAGISRLKGGDYQTRLACGGAPDVRVACEELNALAEVLAMMRDSNLAFTKQIVSAQDDERAEIGRDLHDEFGPLLFAARAHTHALQQHQSDPKLTALAGEIAGIVEAIQKTNSRLLARLRPLDLENLGLTRSIAALVESPAARAGRLAADVKLDSGLDRLDELSARTVYRFVQEAITNVLRHANARSARVIAKIEGTIVTAEVSDDGVGMSEGMRLGRGLQGMKERIGALGGTFQVSSTPAGTIIRCALPIG